jgi:phage-related minor tail protein
MAKKDNEAKIIFSAETGGFNTAIKKANDEMSKLRAELKLNAEQMKTTGETAEGLENKHRILTNQLEVAQDKTTALSQKLDKAREIFGENSAEVSKLETQLTNARIAEEKIKQAIQQCETALSRQAESATDNRNALQKLTDEIEEQQGELNRLKSEYQNAVLTYGKTSTEARELGTAIETLSDELKQNRAELANTERSANALDNSFEEVDEGAELLVEGFTVMKGAMASLVADGITKVAEGLKNVATEAFTMADDIDSATDSFVAKTGESKEAAGEFEAAMVDIYNGNYGESFEDISSSMATVKTAFGEISADKLENLTQKALVMRDTFDFDVTESVRGANSMIDQFGITADEAFNLVAQGAQNGLNQNGDLLDVINEYSVHFKNAGYSAEDMFNMLANGVESGTWSVDKLGDAVKEFNIRMSDGSAKEAVEALGFSWEKVSEDWGKGGNSAKEVFSMMFNELDGLENTTEGYSIGVGLLGTMYEDLGHDAVLAMTSTKGEISTTKNALDEIDSVKYDNLGSAFEGIKRNLQTSVAEPIKNEVMPVVNEFIEETDWQSAGDTIGTVFANAAKGAVAIAEGVKSAVSWMKEHKAIMITIASVIGVLTTAITAYNIVQGVKNAMDAANVTTVWALVAAHWAQATAAMAAIAPYILVVAAIAAVIAIIVLCIKYWDEIVAAVGKAWEKIKEVLSSWGEWINTNVIQPVASFFSGLWEGVKETAVTIWEGIKSFFSGIPEWFSTNIIEPIKSFFTGLWEGLKAIWDGICNVVSFAFQLIIGIITTAFQLITLPFRMIWENCKEIIFAAWEWIKNTVSNRINAVKTVITTVMTAVSTFFNTVWNGIKTVFTTVWNAITGFLSPKLEAIKNGISTAWNAVKNTTTTVFNAVKSFITTIWNAIKNAISTAWEFIKSVVSAAINNVKTNISNVFNAVKNTVSTIWNGIKNTISTVWNGIKSGVSSAVNGVKNTVSSVFESVKSKVTSVWNGIKSAITKPIEEAKNKVKSVVDSIQGFFSGMKLQFPKIKMPHFSVTGKFSLDPPSVPKLGIEWYKEGGIMTKPTIFGMNGSSLMAGGEAGAEAILPIDKLEGYISNVVEKSVTVVNLQALADQIEALANRPIEMNINGKHFATATASDSDSVNGLRSTFVSRGLAIE